MSVPVQDMVCLRLKRLPTDLLRKAKLSIGVNISIDLYGGRIGDGKGPGSTVIILVCLQYHIGRINTEFGGIRSDGSRRPAQRWTESRGDTILA